jgi:hypothetical protein
LGNGYYVLEADGGVFAFGDATFYGSTGRNNPAGRHVTAMALSYDDNGVTNGYCSSTTAAASTPSAAPSLRLRRWRLVGLAYRYDITARRWVRHRP